MNASTDADVRHMVVQVLPTDQKDFPWLATVIQPGEPHAYFYARTKRLALFKAAAHLIEEVVV